MIWLNRMPFLMQAVCKARTTHWAMVLLARFFRFLIAFFLDMLFLDGLELFGDLVFLPLGTGVKVIFSSSKFVVNLCFLLELI